MRPVNEPEPIDMGSQTPSAAVNANSSSIASEYRTQKASLMRQVRRQSTNQPLPEPQESLQDPSTGHFLSSSDREFTISGSFIQEISLLMQEMDNMRSRMAEIVRRQQEEAATRNTTLATLVPSDGDDRQTAPPAYPELGEC
ncbi:hypothetical protein A7U60_g3468 [Sanghuangporus baumii]|uniref:Uncharacterized protein n=1 Tax=Sanghuangporus baumii TaxID=108892 RepID=A0A9Q5I0F8_SANBA|nr:hypothetical protein A7U60_g3468 [Sanghuangporus baumii]